MASRQDTIRWKARYQIHKFDNEDLAAAGVDVEAPSWEAISQAVEEGRLSPYEIIDREGNLLLYGGASNLWQCLIGNGTATTGQNLTYFNNGEANIGVGNGTAAAVATQTDLQGASKTRKGQESGFPSHTDGVAIGAEDIQFKSIFATGDANYAWEEWGVFNAGTGGRMLNRKVESLGTKTSAATWTFTVTLTLA